MGDELLLWNSFSQAQMLANSKIQESPANYLHWLQVASWEMDLQDKTKMQKHTQLLDANIPTFTLQNIIKANHKFKTTLEN